MGRERVMNAKAQEALHFGLSWDVDEAFTESMRPLRDGYMAMGNLVAAGATGIDKADLPKMFEPGSGRHLRYKAVFQLGQRSSMEIRRAIIEPLANFFGLGIAPMIPMTDKERADRAEAALHALGPIGVAAWRAAMGGKS